jgi:hypothetical protein
MNSYHCSPRGQYAVCDLDLCSETGTSGLLYTSPNEGCLCIAQGKAAWHEKGRERKVSLTEAAVNHRIKATEAHRRWMRKNRVSPPQGNLIFLVT